MGLDADETIAVMRVSVEGLSHTAALPDNGLHDRGSHAPIGHPIARSEGRS
jgi:hypothetical protein